MKEFSIRFPHWVSQAGRDTFLPAQYKYDSSNTVFDNSILTWGTDYGITCVMIYGVLRLLSAKPWNSAYQNEVSWGLRLRAAALLLSYAISVFAGGIAHQNYSTIDSLNSLSFRILWTICVGSVTAAGGYMVGLKKCIVLTVYLVLTFIINMTSFLALLLITLVIFSLF